MIYGKKRGFDAESWCGHCNRALLASRLSIENIGMRVGALTISLISVLFVSWRNCHEDVEISENDDLFWDLVYV